MNGWWFLVIYLAGLPVMFKATGRQAYRDFAEDPWRGDTWALVLVFTFMWPGSWVALLVLASMDRLSSISFRRLDRLARWTAPKHMRKPLDTDQDT